MNLKTHCIRLHQGDDLKESISFFCNQFQIKAAIILSSVGSLSKINFRLAGATSYLTLDNNFEIINLNGTLSMNGIHLHISVSDNKGHVFGGHLMDGNIINTTCELVFAEIVDFEFKRDLDLKTNYKEILFIKK